MKTYNNYYGKLILEETGELLKVSEIRGINLPDELKFSLDIAEKIALITENRGIQISGEFHKNPPKMYVIMHVSPSTGYIGKIVSLEFNSDINPTEELAKFAKYQSMKGLQ